MSLLDDPLFAELRAEATQWHLTQSATVRRYGTMLVNGRDQPTEVLIFYGLVGVNRREGQGLLPSPGADGRYDWDGYADAMLHPYDQDPPEGWIGHANQRSLPRGYGMQLSSTWYYPERAERLGQLAELMDGYNEFHDFDPRELALIEPLRALRLMRDISPAYLKHFMDYADALLWLEQADGGARPAPKNIVLGERDKKRKPARGKAGS